MATIFRGRVLTAVAVLSTHVAVNSQPAQNRLILQPPPPRSNKDFPTPTPPIRTQFVQYHDPQFSPPNPKPEPLRDFTLPKAANPPPYVHDVRNRHVFLAPPNPQTPFAQSDWPKTKPPIRSLIVDEILNPNPFLLSPVGLPFYRHLDWQTPAQPIYQPYGIHHRPQLAVAGDPRKQTDWPVPVAALRTVSYDLLRNGILLPLPPVAVPFSLPEWPIPSRAPAKPETFLFYYIQDQTRPGFIQFDWPNAPKLPSITADPIPNRLVLPIVLTTTPFHQDDWPNASQALIAKIGDPYNRNVFLPVPQGQAQHQHDWPLPQGPRLKPDTHTLNDLGLLAQPIVNPERRNYDWPLPARVMMIAIIWTPEGTTPIYLPTFRAEWAENSNQIVGPWEPIPETH